MARREREVLERAVHAIPEQAANTNKVIDGATSQDVWTWQSRVRHIATNASNR